MDDQNFDDPNVAKEWISTSESRTKDCDIFKMIEKWMIQINPRQILDIGCGQGSCSEVVTRRIPSYTGLDSSQLLIQRANQLYQGTRKEFVVGNLYNLPLRDQSYDAAFSVLVWHLLKDLEAAAEELSRILKADGSFLIITANPAAVLEWKNFYPSGAQEGRKISGQMCIDGQFKEPDTIYVHSFENIKKSLKDVNLEIVVSEKFRFLAGSSKPILISIEGCKV